MTEQPTTRADRFYFAAGTVLVLAVSLALIWGAGRAGQYLDQRFVRPGAAPVVQTSGT